MKKDVPHFTMRITPRFEMALNLLRLKLGVSKADVVRLAVAEMAERHGVEVPAEKMKTDDSD